MTERDLLEPDALRAFAVFAEHRNFTAAAAALHISQPSLHVKIRKIAAALGTELYERDGRRLTLTAAGERLATFALDSRRRLDDFLRDLDREAAPVLTIAAGRGALRWVVDAPVRRLGAAGRRLHLITADRDAALAALASGRADAAVIGYDAPPRQFESTQIAAHPQVLVLDRRHPLAGRTGIRLADLADLDLIVPPAGRPHRRALDRALLDAGVEARVAAEVDGWDLLVHLASLGIGATIVNGCVRPPADLCAVPIRDLPQIRYWVAWRRQRLAHVHDLLAEVRRP
jgi:DNA-binding transcriptional LysR family regulator